MSYSEDPTGVPPSGDGALFRSPPRAKRPRRTLLIVGSIAVLALSCLAGAALIAWEFLEDSARSPSEAVSDYYAGVRNRDETQVRDALCRRDRAKAADAIDDLHEKLLGEGPELQDIRWTLKETRDVSRNSRVLVTDTTFAVKNVDTIYSVHKRVSFTLVEEDGWRICGVAF